MTVASMQGGGGSPVQRRTGGNLADVVELILDKGLVIDVFARVSLVGIEILTVDARVVVASVDTYLRFAEATNRLDLDQTGGKDLPELMQSMAEGGAKGKTKGMIDAAKEKFGEFRGTGQDAKGKNQPGRRRESRIRERDW
ncbi:gas vesicle protein GvpJ [Saccharopolyspora sp. NPDC002686]|uniref:gas vesicle protein GvpJ n=1 Tax=Saccharopolyspora sp. NPDC002686 TaxID=3154541 RepID=UPI0033236F67